jgi:hypothetical protein
MLTYIIKPYMKTYVGFYGCLKNNSHLIHCMLMGVERISKGVLNMYKNMFFFSKRPRKFFCRQVFYIILN